MSTQTGTASGASTSAPDGDRGSTTDLRRRIVQAATCAPSVHNTQPWRFASCEQGLDLYADDSRRLPVLDPRGRQLHLSCGAALLHAQVAARGFGLTAEPQLLPNPDATRTSCWSSRSCWTGQTAPKAKIRRTDRSSLPGSVPGPPPMASRRPRYRLTPSVGPRAKA